MKTIVRQRNSGKTTILLHYMAASSLSIYVAASKSAAKRAYELSRKLNLELDECCFLDAADLRVELCRMEGYAILIDDINIVIKRHPRSAFRLIARASIVTLSEDF